VHGRLDRRPQDPSSARRPRAQSSIEPTKSSSSSSMPVRASQELPNSGQSPRVPRASAPQIIENVGPILRKPAADPMSVNPRVACAGSFRGSFDGNGGAPAGGAAICAPGGRSGVILRTPRRTTRLAVQSLPPEFSPAGRGVVMGSGLNQIKIRTIITCDLSSSNTSPSVVIVGAPSAVSISVRPAACNLFSMGKTGDRRASCLKASQWKQEGRAKVPSSSAGPW
jgi:hypothetical protein